MTLTFSKHLHVIPAHLLSYKWIYGRISEAIHATDNGVSLPVCKEEENRSKKSNTVVRSEIKNAGNPPRLLRRWLLPCGTEKHSSL
jgi:hypothetical protein